MGDMADHHNDIIFNNLASGELCNGCGCLVYDFPGCQCKKEKPVVCPYCRKPAQYTSNEEVYGKPYGKWPMIWLCKCQPGFAYVGCVRDTDKPLGTMASKPLREMRIQAHAAIDPIWKEGRMKRGEVYEWLSGRMGRVVHVGESDTAACRQIILLAEELERQLDAEDDGDDEFYDASEFLND